MEPTQIITVLIFAVTIVLIITRKIDPVVAALLGVVAMVAVGSITEIQAFTFVDWDVIMILISVWLIAGYFGKTGIPEKLGDLTLRLSKGNIPLFVTLLGVLAGFISMFIDNVVVVLMLAPIVFHIRKIYNFKATGPILFIGLCSNFMGTALLLGDLPPQMLHSVSGIEFLGFIWHSGRPSSFLILTVTYLLVCLVFYFKFKRSELAMCTLDEKAAHADAGETMVHIKDKRFAFLVCAGFIWTVIGMSLRQFLGFKLGFIAFAGTLIMVLVFELLKKPLKMDVPDLEGMLGEIEWSAIGFYVALFALVGALEYTHVLKIVANWLIPFIKSGLLTGTSVLYWVTSPIVAFVEHDAYILTILYVIRDLHQSLNINAWPYYWALVWAGTLGSNLTIAGAPALYVALTMGEKEDGEKMPLKKFFSYTVPYVLLSLVICYVFLVLIWVLPFMK
ncbi:MAG: permease [Deltaproteobacteria bacterium]|nr:permease [Deltaproteobacteria bacterium]